MCISDKYCSIITCVASVRAEGKVETIRRGGGTVLVPQFDDKKRRMNGRIKRIHRPAAGHAGKTSHLSMSTFA